MVDAVRDRVEVSTHGETWHVTAGSFDGALAYARERFDDPVVLSRKDRGRWWPRVTLVVTEDPAYAASAPSLEDLAHPRGRRTRRARGRAGPEAAVEDGGPTPTCPRCWRRCSPARTARPRLAPGPAAASGQLTREARVSRGR